MQLLSLWNSLQDWLFPALQETLGDELTEKEKKFIKTCELAELDAFMDPYLWKGIGRPPKNRLPILKAFVAKSVYNFSQTRAFLDYINASPSLRRLCGWETRSEIPHESTFSRHFELFATTNLPENIHTSMVKKTIGDKITGHLSKDSTSIEGREKAVKQEKQKTKKKYGRGRPKKNEVREPKSPRRVQLQLERELDVNLKDLPQECDKGTKRNAKGYKMSWKGYKLHLDCADGDIPISAVLTSASVHDSQVAIPLMQKSAKKVTSLYDLMDSAYDSPEIHEFSRSLGHIPIIDHNKRKGEKKEFCPATKIRYNERSTAERVNSNLKDNYAARDIRVKGNCKVFAHLMFGIIALTASQLFNMLE